MTPFKQAYDAVEREIEHRYGIGVSISDVLDPNTGDFDGLQIKVDYDQDMESALFVLIHLFGHTVQWNLSEEYRAIGTDLSIGKGDAFLFRLRDYEKMATRYSLRLLHDVGIKDLDRWVSDWWEADWRYLAHYYRTGEKLEFRGLIQPGIGELLTPLDIPPFTPQRWYSRWSF